MAAPTTAFTDNATGVIATSGEGNGLLLAVNPKENRVTFGFRGTFTSAVVAVRGHLAGLSATSYYPLTGIVVSSGALVASSVSISLTNSTNGAFTFDTTGCDYVEVWGVSGTLTDLNVDAVQSLSDANTPPLVINSVSGGDDFTTDITLLDNVKLIFGTGDDITMKWDGTNFVADQAAADSVIQWGVSGAGINHTFFGDTATLNMTWDQSNNQLLFADNALLAIGTGSGAAGDITFSWNASKMLVAQLATNSAIDWGVDDDGIDQNWYGATASTKMMWDQSADSLILSGAAFLTFTGTTGQPEIHLTDNLADALSIEISGSTDLMIFTTTDNAESVSPIGLRTRSNTAVAVTGATTLKLSDSGGIFTVSQAAAYDIDLPSPTSGPGCTYVFSLTAAGANDVTITVAGSAATFVGVIVNDVTSVVPATGSTLTYASGKSALGDLIIARSVATNLYSIEAITSTAGGITIA